MHAHKQFLEAFKKEALTERRASPLAALNVSVLLPVQHLAGCPCCPLHACSLAKGDMVLSAAWLWWVPFYWMAIKWGFRIT